jgi:hypothetical protein
MRANYSNSSLFGCAAKATFSTRLDRDKIFC